MSNVTTANPSSQNKSIYGQVYQKSNPNAWEASRENAWEASRENAWEASRELKLTSTGRVTTRMFSSTSMMGKILASFGFNGRIAKLKSEFLDEFKEKLRDNINNSAVDEDCKNELLKKVELLKSISEIKNGIESDIQFPSAKQFTDFVNRKNKDINEQINKLTPGSKCILCTLNPNLTAQEKSMAEVNYDAARKYAYFLKTSDVFKKTKTRR